MPVPVVEGDTVNTDTSQYEDEPFIDWDGQGSISRSEFDDIMSDYVNSHTLIGINTTSSNSEAYQNTTNNIAGIFGLPYQFSPIVDPRIEKNKSSSSKTADSKLLQVGRKYTDKILSVMPVLFLTPGEPVFMAGYGKESKNTMANAIINSSILGDDDADAYEVDDGRYYSFNSNFTEYKKYANMALRALSLFMGIEDKYIPIPGKEGQTVQLKKIDVEDFMNNDFTKLFGTQCTVPFYLDAETSISEDFTNDTTESMVSSMANQFSSTARELQFIMGSKDYGGITGALSSAASSLGDAAGNLTSALSEVMVGNNNNLLTRVTNELTTVVSGGKIVFPEIWGGSDYSKSYSISLKLRSPDPDPVSIFLNIYMPIILLISMTAPRQLGNKSTAYESPFLVRATYKSIFSCDLGLISSLSITKGGPDRWNVLGQPVTADVTIQIKDLYHTMFISKKAGLITNTAQMDYLAGMAGIDMNEFEPLRMAKLYNIIMSNVVRDFADDTWGNVKRSLTQKTSNFLSKFADVRFLQ